MCVCVYFLCARVTHPHTPAQHFNRAMGMNIRLRREEIYNKYNRYTEWKKKQVRENGLIPLWTLRVDGWKEDVPFWEGVMFKTKDHEVDPKAFIAKWSKWMFVDDRMSDDEHAMYGHKQLSREAIYNKFHNEISAPDQEKMKKENNVPAWVLVPDGFKQNVSFYSGISFYMNYTLPTDAVRNDGLRWMFDFDGSDGGGGGGEVVDDKTNAILLNKYMMYAYAGCGGVLLLQVTRRVNNTTAFALLVGVLGVGYMKASADVRHQLN